MSHLLRPSWKTFIFCAIFIAKLDSGWLRGALSFQVCKIFFSWTESFQTVSFLTSFQLRLLTSDKEDFAWTFTIHAIEMVGPYGLGITFLQKLLLSSNTSFSRGNTHLWNDMSKDWLTSFHFFLDFLQRVQQLLFCYFCNFTFQVRLNELCAVDDILLDQIFELIRQNLK